MGLCKRELELQYLHGKNYFCLDVTAGNGQKDKAAVTQIRFIGLPVCPSSTGSSSSTQANINGKDSKIHTNVCQAREGFSTLQVRGSTGRRLDGDSVVTRGDAQLSPKPAPQFVTQMSFLMSENTEQDAHGSTMTGGCNVWRKHQVKKHFYQKSSKTVEVLDLQLRLTPVTADKKWIQLFLQHPQKSRKLSQRSWLLLPYLFFLSVFSGKTNCCICSYKDIEVEKGSSHG